MCIYIYIYIYIAYYIIIYIYIYDYICACIYIYIYLFIYLFILYVQIRGHTNIAGRLSCKRLWWEFVFSTRGLRCFTEWPSLAVAQLSLHQQHLVFQCHHLLQFIFPQAVQWPLSQLSPPQTTKMLGQVSQVPRFLSQFNDVP